MSRACLALHPGSPRYPGAPVAISAGPQCQGAGRAAQSAPLASVSCLETTLEAPGPRGPSWGRRKRRLGSGGWGGGVGGGGWWWSCSGGGGCVRQGDAAPQWCSLTGSGSRCLGLQPTTSGSPSSPEGLQDRILDPGPMLSPPNTMYRHKLAERWGHAGQLTSTPKYWLLGKGSGWGAEWGSGHACPPDGLHWAVKDGRGHSAHPRGSSFPGPPCRAAHATLHPIPGFTGFPVCGETAGPHLVGTWGAGCHCPRGLLGGEATCPAPRMMMLWRPRPGAPPTPSPCTCTNGPLFPLTPELKTLLMAACQEMSLPHQRAGGASTVLQQSLPVLMGLGPPQRWVGSVSPRPRRAGTEAAQPALSAGSVVPLPGGWDRREGPRSEGQRQGQCCAWEPTPSRPDRPAHPPCLGVRRLPTPWERLSEKIK